MNLEFAENRHDLKFEKEYNLNTKPLEIDLLIIKKQPEVYLSNEIGAFFHGHTLRASLYAIQQNNVKYHRI